MKTIEHEIGIDASHLLLAEGFRDQLPADTKLQETLLQHFSDFFSRHNYQKVNPPLLEFETTLRAEKPGIDNLDDRVAGQSMFRLTDPLSQRVLAVRSDITVQIARLADSQLAQWPKPLRLHYAGPIIRAEGSEWHRLRQLTQLGCELIGFSEAETVLADSEAIGLAVNSLVEIGLGELTLDITHPPLVQSLIQQVNFDKAERMALNKALAAKDKHGLVNLLSGTDKPRQRLSEQLTLLLSVSNQAKQGLAQVLAASCWDEASLQILGDLSELIEKLSQAMDEGALKLAQLTIDFTERRGVAYHNGPAFSLFADDYRGELGRGGRYRTAIGRQLATGFSLYLEELVIGKITDQIA